ncbi:ATP-binding protein [Acidovorax sp. sic0104]|uniref:AAA family ATPase n=1 Tax=Acidovorax sp. sic0104 TaxID=2854784 RepID=UPI001C483D54|nr:ATP-binding protein [Acidovorax sp. sic0104]MBV7542052.1 AAA family ATPase [Acidovorax sp. sic0104]
MSLVTTLGVFLPALESIRSPLIRKAIFETKSRRGGDNEDAEVVLDLVQFEDEELRELREYCEAAGVKKAVRVVDAILKAGVGNVDAKVPSFGAFMPMLVAFLRRGRIDGWVFVEGPDGCSYPELVLSASYSDNTGRHEKREPQVVLNTVAFGVEGDRRSRVLAGAQHRTHTFRPEDAIHKSVPEILANAGLHIETKALRDAYQSTMDRFDALVRNQFAEQFRVNGRCFSIEGRAWERGEELVGRRVIHDQPAKEFAAGAHLLECPLFNDDEFRGVVPIHPLVKVFDLKSHETMWVHSDFMKPYEYNPGLKDKLILPQEMHDLLRILTTDLGVFVDDFIEGKSAGNIVLIKGPPGVGKTLTAEVYSEVIRRPLYAVHTGTLGTSPQAIHDGLKETLARIKRWNCVGLIDEADVYLRTRADNIDQNAIVAEFLRTTEYAVGLLFMTTNRDDIDDAFLSRAAAVIQYEPPSPELAGRVWKALGENFGKPLDEGLIAQLVAAFPSLPPRDAKMLLRLALRVSLSEGGELSLDVFRRCANFRAIKVEAAGNDPQARERANG